MPQGVATVLPPACSALRRLFAGMAVASHRTAGAAAAAAGGFPAPLFRNEVDNNGDYRSEQEKADQILKYQSSGYGVRNVCERIQVLYGTNGTVGIKSSPGGGTEVKIRIPKKAEKKAG